MTSPSRRKRQITPLSSRRTNNGSVRKPRPLVAGWLAALTLFVAAMPLAAGAKELQWRSGRSAFKPSPPAHDEHRADPAVLPANFEEDGGGLHLGNPSAGRGTFRSVVSQRDEAIGAMRSAQLPPAGAGEDSLFDEQPEDPLGPVPDALPPLETPEPEGLEFDMPPQPEGGTLQLEQNQGQPIEGTPFQPAPLDTTMPPGPLPTQVPAPSVDTMEAERERSAEACAQGLADLEIKTIDTLALTIAVTGDEGTDFPYECSLDEGRWHEGRCWEQTTYLWKASALCHKPLYFEDEHLERYGHSWAPCCQPLISGCHFFTRLPVLPYCMGVEPPNECIYALGHYRPGSCAPYMCNPIPISCRGALFQAGAAVGAAAVLP